MHMREQDLELYVCERLGSREMARVESHLCTCGMCRNKLPETLAALTQTEQVQPEQEAKERRREQRIPTDEAGLVQSIVPFSNDRLDARILEVSRGGMKIQIRKPLDPGMMVKIRLKQVVAFGEVRYCNAAGMDFNIGIRIENVFP